MRFCHNNLQSKKHEKCRGREFFSFSYLLPMKMFQFIQVLILSIFYVFTYSGEMMLTVNIVNIQGHYDTCISRGMTYVSHF